MNLELLAAFEEEIDALAEMRVRFILDLHPDYAPRAEEIRRAILVYLREHLAQKRYIGYLGRSDGQLVCSAGLLLYDLPPLHPEQTRRVGHVLNFFTAPEFRRQGVGRRLVEFIVADAKARGLDRLALNATEQGEPLYRQTGFHEQEEAYLVKELLRLAR